MSAQLLKSNTATAIPYLHKLRETENGKRSRSQESPMESWQENTWMQKAHTAAASPQPIQRAALPRAISSTALRPPQLKLIKKKKKSTKVYSWFQPTGISNVHKQSKLLEQYYQQHRTYSTERHLDNY